MFASVFFCYFTQTGFCLVFKILSVTGTMPYCTRGGLSDMFSVLQLEEAARKHEILAAIVKKQLESNHRMVLP